MMKYGKLTYKTFQIRMSDEELKDLTKFIKKFGITRREFILAAKRELSYYDMIKDGEFYNKKDYAHRLGGAHYGNRKDTCELCKDKYRESSSDTRIIGHHYLGYDGDNANKVKWLCRRCHGFCHRDINKDKSWEEIERNFYDWDGDLSEVSDRF